MSKRSRKQSAKQPAHTSVMPKAEPDVAASEQLRRALQELRTSTVHLLETALGEAQASAAWLLSEVKARASGWLATFKPAIRSQSTDGV